MGGCRGKLGRPRCRPRWDTHLNSRSLLNWNSSLAATAAGSVKKCTNGQVKTIWLPFSGSHNYRVQVCRSKDLKVQSQFGFKNLNSTYVLGLFDTGSLPVLKLQCVASRLTLNNTSTSTRIIRLFSIECEI